MSVCECRAQQMVEQPRADEQIATTASSSDRATIVASMALANSYKWKTHRFQRSHYRGQRQQSLYLSIVCSAVLLAM